jgi:transposase
MARYKAYDYNQATMIPVCLSEQLEPGTLEYTIHYVVQERLDLSAFDLAYCNDSQGRPAYDPRILLKVILLGYSRGKLSSRKLEAACKENILFMAMTCGQTPDHSTIAGFVSGMGEGRISSLFAQVLLVCEEEGLLSGTHFSMDGYKLSTNASKEWSGTHADLLKKKKTLEKLVRDTVREHKHNDRSRREGADAAIKRTEKLKRSIAKIGGFVAENPPRIGRQQKEIQSNITDPQSAKMKSSHGIIQGYNANAMVDELHQVIVHGQAFGEGDDGALAEAMLEGARQNLEAAGRGGDALQEAVVSADTGYFSARNLEACQEAGVDAYIPDPHFRKRDPRFAEAARYRRPTDKRKMDYQSKRQWFGPEAFKYDAVSGRLICPAGKRLYNTSKNITTANGYLVSCYRATKSDCGQCAFRKQCLRNPESNNPRQVRIFNGRVTETITSAMKHKIDTREGRAIYSRRLGIVEPVFANIAAQKGMNRSTLRGTEKVNTQWKLYCMIHNLGKVAKYAHRGN